MREKSVRLKEFVGSVKLAEGDAPSEVQILRTGSFNHILYGPFEITPKMLDDMVRNFQNRVKRQDIPIDYFHESDREAAGWFTELFVRNEESGHVGLYGRPRWTPKAEQMIRDGEVRYFSADFNFEWTDPETGVRYENVLNGGGLVNRPFIKDMKPVELSEEMEKMTIQELQAKLAEESTKLSEATAKLAEVEKQNGELKTELAETKGKLAVVLKEQAEAKKEAEFAKLLSEGKACAAQKDAYMAGDMQKFIELAQPINPVNKGGQGFGEGATSVELSEEEKAICKKLGLTEEEYRAANPKK